MPDFPGFIGPSAPSLSAIASSQRTMNFFLETVGPQKQALYPTPGQTPWLTAASSSGVLTDVGGRGGIVAGSRTFVVMGGGYYEIFVDGTAIRRGTVATDGNVAQLAYNGLTGGQVLVASGGNAYCHVLSSNAFTQVLTGEAHQIGMLDEYFLALNQTIGKLRLSNLNDGLTWDPTQFALRSDQPDPWVAMVVNPPDIWLLGSQSGCVWYDAGTSPFPLAMRTGLAIPYGITAPFSLTVSGGRVTWLGANKDGDGLVVSAQGYGVSAISSHEVDTAIAGYKRTSRITDAESFIYQINGHVFTVLRFPSANATWQADVTEGTPIWTELGTWNSARGDYDVWHPRFHLAAFGLHLVGDDRTATIGSLDIAYATEADGSIIRRLRRSPVVLEDMQRMNLSRFELLLEAGIGLPTGQGSNPVVMARFSGDGGKTWSNERQCGSGPLGQYGRQVFWNRLGGPRLFVAEVTMTDPISWRILNAFLNNAPQTQKAA